MRNCEKNTKMIYHLFKTLNTLRLSGTSFVAQYKKKKYSELLVIKKKISN